MFYERLQELCRRQHTTVSSMLRELGLSTGSTGNWKKGQFPKGDVLMKIADYLGTSVDLLKLYRSTPEKAKYKVLCDLERIVKKEIHKFER